MSAGTPFAPGGLLGFLRRPMARRPAKSAITKASFLQGESAGLEADYEAAIDCQLRKMGIDPGCVHVRVCTMGQTPGGFDIVAGFITLVRWEKTPGSRLVLGMPSLEKRVRRFAAATWLADYSAFAGLWLSVPDKLETAGELKSMLRQVSLAAPGKPEAPCETPEDYEACESVPA
ncbi:MAG: hypothetical protein ABW051_00260 [Burkholderiaceae bacterium]